MKTAGLWLALVLGAAGYGQAETLEMILEISGDADITLREPIFLVVTLVNSGRDAVEVDLGVEGLGSYRFALVHADGRRVEAPAVSAEGFSFEDAVTLDAGEQYRKRLLLDRFLQVDAAGTYRLEARFTGAVTGAGGRQLSAPAAPPLVLEVQPRSEERLAETCRQLAATATALRDMGESLIAAEALSRVGDPVAVAALGQVLASGFLPTQSFAVQGLKRIGDSAAVETLAGALHQGGTIGDEARSALKRLRRKATDPEVLKLIDEALPSAPPTGSE